MKILPRKSFRYTPLERALKKLYRKFFPVPKSPYTMGEVRDICSVHLVPPNRLEKFFDMCIQLLQAIKGEHIGDYLEFGVFNGSSMASMYKTAQSFGLS